MHYNFDKKIDRHGTFSTQWDYTIDRFGSADVLPFSISDADFAVLPEIQTALKERINHPIYGYTRWHNAAYLKSICNWFLKRDYTQIEENWIAYSPSVVFSISIFIRMLSEPGEAVAVFTPMYDAFYGVIQKNGRSILPIRLGDVDSGYQIDWDTLKLVLSQEKTKLLLLTNPHNPTGKVFTVSELEKIIKICHENNVFIISDDIHKDIVYSPNKYVPICKVANDNYVLCCSASKAFNIPGLIGSYLIEPNESLYKMFLTELKQKNALSSVSILGMTAQIAAYQYGEEYIDEMNAYIYQNMQLVKRYLATNDLGLHFEIPQGTYLAWINATATNLSSAKLQERLVKRGKVGIMSGKVYGDSNYLRMNLACQKEKVIEGLERIKYALS